MELRCPICQQPLYTDHDHAWCNHGHRFDRSKQGYFNLLKHGKRFSGDDKDMVETRIRFLDHGYYDFLIETINVLVKPYSSNTILDIACGPGYYLKRCDGRSKYGLDLSKPAIAYAAKHDPTSQYLIANGFDLPFMDRTIDLVTVIFAPYSLDEIFRVLKTNGIFIRVSPAPMHLFEIKQLLYPTVYVNHYKPIDHSHLTLVKTMMIADRSLMDGPTMENCFAMTPYRYKTDPNAIKLLASAHKKMVTMEFYIDVMIKTK